MDDDRTRQERIWQQRIHSGDMSVLEEIYDAYAPSLYRQAFAVLGIASDAEDVLQDVFLKLVRRKGPAIRDLRAYLMTAARHEAYSLWRKRFREWPSEQPELYSSERPYQLVSEDVLEVREALQQLPPAQREVVCLKVLEGLTFEEIGKAVQASVNTVASRYRYAMKKLRQALGDSTYV
jgi:RNA polymerase sigma-70 factor (ECF subfamily)